MPDAIDSTDQPTPRRKPKAPKTRIGGREMRPSTLMGSVAKIGGSQR